MLQERGRSLLTIFAVSLGVAVVVAIDLAGDAAAGSFRSSMESLTGEADLEVTAVGGLDEAILGELVSLPYPLAYSARVEGYAVHGPDGAVVPVFGLDLLGDATLASASPPGSFEFSGVISDQSAWVGAGLGARRDETLQLQVDDRIHEFRVQGVLEAEGFAGVSVRNVVILDIATAQRVFGRMGLLDRIQIHLPDDEAASDWRERLEEHLPRGVQLAVAGARLEQNQKMLGAFRWNLRILSWLSLIVGAFLIYNTIAVSVVRRRTEIGILRALGASRNLVRWAFLAEAALLGAAGTVLGVAAGRWMAEGAVQLMSLTVQTLYVTSAPGELALTPVRLLGAAAAGVGVALLAAWLPASEAAGVSPSEAMARGRNDYQSRLRTGRNLGLSAAAALAAGVCSLLPPAGGTPVGGYLATVLLIASAAYAAPSVIQSASRWGARWAGRLAGVSGFLGSRSLGAALARTSILVAALSTAVAMMVSVGILVGSFRETVLVWMDRQIQADVYVRAAGNPASDRFPTIGADTAERIAAVPGVEAVERFRAYPITVDGAPATLGGGDTLLHGSRSRVRFLDGGGPAALRTLTTGDFAIVSEPFARKHDVWTDDTVALPLRGREVSFQVLGVFYDYTSERGLVVIDRSTLLRHLPDPALSSIAVHVLPGEDPHAMRERIVQATAGRELYVATNSSLRAEAIAIFDRTFAVTWALEAIALTVAILGMAGALVALVLDRKREIAVLRFLGASAPQVRRLILTESGLLGLLSIVVGVIEGAALSLVLVYVINKQSFGWTIQFHWPVGLLLSAVSLIFVACVVAGIYPAGLATRLNPIEVIHEE